MSSLRINPPDEFIEQFVSIFFPNPDFTHVIEINTTLLHQDTIIEKIRNLFPELSIYYYPSKLNSLFENLTFDNCLSILRQILRKKGFTLQTKTIRKHQRRERFLIIRPKSLP